MKIILGVLAVRLLYILMEVIIHYPSNKGTIVHANIITRYVYLPHQGQCSAVGYLNVSDKSQFYLRKPPKCTPQPSNCKTTDFDFRKYTDHPHVSPGGDPPPKAFCWTQLNLGRHHYHTRKCKILEIFALCDGDGNYCRIRLD